LNHFYHLSFLIKNRLAFLDILLTSLSMSSEHILAIRDKYLAIVVEHPAFAY